MNDLTFNELPGAVAQLFVKLEGIEKILQEKQIHQQPESDQFLTIQETGKYLNMAVQTIYGLVHRKKIPVSKQGKRLYFSKQDLTKWIRSGRKQTQAEIELEADLHLMKFKKGGVK